jgi:hypothetical protein
MAEVMDNNTESLLTSLITSSQPSLNSETTIESFVNTKETPNSRKRPSPDSPQVLSMTSAILNFVFTGTGSIAERVLHCFLPKIPLI